MNRLLCPVNGRKEEVNAVFAFRKTLAGLQGPLIERKGALTGYSCRTRRD
nr:hypothetical protein [uncultured Parabacteroides sp.]